MIRYTVALALLACASSVAGQDANAWREPFASGQQALTDDDHAAYAEQMTDAVRLMPAGHLTRPFAQYHAARAAALLADTTGPTTSTPCGRKSRRREPEWLSSGPRWKKASRSSRRPNAARIFHPSGSRSFTGCSVADQASLYARLISHTLTAIAMEIQMSPHIVVLTPVISDSIAASD